MVLGAWVTVLTALLLIVPGALIGRRMVLPWPVAIAAGPPITLAVVSIATVLYSAIGVRWNIVTALIAFLVSLLVAWAYAALWGTRSLRGLDPPPPSDAAGALDRRGVVAVSCGIAIGAAIIAVTCIRPLVKTAPDGLNNIPQVWDSLWHASSLRWIHESGVGSALRMGDLMNYDTHGFNYYPNTWHALGAILLPISGANPVELYNTYAPAAAAITSPFGVAALAYWFARHRLSPNRAAAVAGTSAAVAALFPSLPYVEVELTSVPNAVGVSLAPVAAILVISAVRDRRRVFPAALALAGVTATHPSGLVLTGILVLLWWLFEGLRRPSYGRGRDVVTLISGGVVTIVLIAPVVLGTIRVSNTNDLPFFDFRVNTVDTIQGLAQAAFNGTVPLTDHYPIWPLIIVTVIGLAILGWLRCWAGLAAWVVFVLITANAVVALGPLSYPLGAVGGYFYNSPHRLTFVVAMLSAAIAGNGIAMIVLAAADLLSAKTRHRLVPAALLALAVVVAGAGVWKYPSNAQIASKERAGQRVGSDDLAAYHWLANQPGARHTLILNNLDQGSGWIYPATGLRPMFPFYRSNDFSQRERDLFWGVTGIGTDPHINSIVRDMNVHWVIDSPPSYWPFQNGVPDPAHGRQGDPFLALRQHGASGLQVVFRRGKVTIYRVTDAVYAPSGGRRSTAPHSTG